MTPRLRWRLGLAGVLALAAALRLARLGWGLPEHVFPDEGWFLVPARRIAATGDLHADFRTYPPLVSYVLAGVYRIASLARHEPVLPLGRPELVVWGRSVMAASSVATVAAVAALGRALHGPAVGLLAGLFFAVLPLHVVQSRVICSDIPLTLLVVLTLRAAAGIGDAPAWRRMFASGALAGLATATKYPGILVAVAPGWQGLRGLWGSLRTGDRRRALRWLAALAVAALGALAAFSAVYPYWIEDYYEVRRHLRWLEYLSRSVGVGAAKLAPGGGVRGTPVLYQLLILFPAALGPPLCLLGMAGLARMTWRRERGDVMLLVFATATFVFFATARTVFARYYLPLFPVLVVAAADFAHARGRRGAPAAPAVRALALVAAGYGLALSVSLTAHTSVRPQQALRAALERTVAGLGPGAPVVARIPEPAGSYSGIRWVLHGLPVRESDLTLDRAWLAAARPDLVVVGENVEVATLRNAPESEAAATLRALADGTRGYRLVWQIGVGYLNSGFYAWLDPYFRTAGERGEMGFRVYARAGGGG